MHKMLVVLSFFSFNRILYHLTTFLRSFSRQCFFFLSFRTYRILCKHNLVVEMITALQIRTEKGSNKKRTEKARCVNKPLAILKKEDISRTMNNIYACEKKPSKINWLNNTPFVIFFIIFHSRCFRDICRNRMKLPWIITGLIQLQPKRQNIYCWLVKSESVPLRIILHSNSI